MANDERPLSSEDLIRQAREESRSKAEPEDHEARELPDTSGHAEEAVARPPFPDADRTRERAPGLGDERPPGQEPPWSPGGMPDTSEPWPPARPDPQPGFFARLMAFRFWIGGAIAAFIFFGQCAFSGTSFDALEIGDCFEDPGIGTEVASVDTVDCNELHDFELYAIVQLGPDSLSFPGDDSLFTDMEDECITRFDAYVGYDYWTSDYDFVAFIPTEQAWKGGDRTGMCATFEFDPATFDPTQTIGSSRNAGR